jgi:hypothetical protein
MVFAALVAGLVAFAVFDYNRGEEKKKKEEGESSLLHIPESDVRRIEITGKSGQIVLQMDKSEKSAGEGRWRIEAPIKDLADTQAVLSLLKSLHDEKSRDTAAEGAGLDLKVYGLDDPSFRIKLSADDGRFEEVKIGGIKAYDSSLYAQIDELPKVLLVTSTWTDHLEKPAGEYRDKHLYRGEGDTQYDTIEVALDASKPGGPVSYQLIRHGDLDWEMKGVPNVAEISRDQVVALAEQAKSLRAVEFLEFDKNAPGVLSKLGLQKPAITVRLRQGSELKLEIKIAPVKGAEAHVAAISSDLTNVASVFKSAAETLAKRPEDFFDKKAPFKFQPKDVAEVAVHWAGKSADLIKKDATWEGKTPDSAKAVNIDDLLGKISTLEAQRFLEPVKGSSPKGFVKDQIGKGESSLVLKKAGGEAIFELAWGEPVTVKADGVQSKADLKNPGAIEITYHRARTSRSRRVMALSPAAITSLGLESLFAAPATEPAKKEGKQ